MSDHIRARTADLETRAVDGQLVLLDLRSQHYLSLNRTGAELWPLLVDGVPHDDLVRALQDRHGIDELTATRDVDALLHQLEAANLLEPRGADAPGDA